MKKLKLFLSLILIAVLSTLSYGSGSLIPGPNSGQITVQNSSTLITPFDNPARYSITLLNPSSTRTIYVCKATQLHTLTLKTCSSSVNDITLAPGVSFSTSPDGYSGQFTAITDSSTAVLVITED